MIVFSETFIRTNSHHFKVIYQFLAWNWNINAQLDLAWNFLRSERLRKFPLELITTKDPWANGSVQGRFCFLGLAWEKFLVTPLLLCRKALHIQLHSILKNDLIIIDQSSLLSIFTVLRKINQLLYVVTYWAFCTIHSKSM